MLCGKEYLLDEYGLLKSEEECEIPHVPDWYEWERQKVKEELLSGEYRVDTEVDLIIAIDTKHLYRVGEGRLVHDNTGFHLSGIDGKLSFSLKPLASYSINADFFWYELGDIICIGDSHALYYCFPHTKNVVTRARLATEELFKLHKK